MTIRFLAPLSAAYDIDLIENDQTMMAAFYAAGAQAMSQSGLPMRIVDLGVGESPRYVWREVLPIGTPDQDRLRWNDPADRWVSDAGLQVNVQVYPWFVLTRTDAVSEAVAALAFFLADRSADQSAQPFAVAARSGIGSGLSFARSNRVNGFNDVWPTAGPNPFWWSFVPAETDEPDQWWIRYWTHNQAEAPRVWAGWTDDGNVDGADLVDAGAPDAVTVPPRAAPARLVMWLPGTFRINNVYGRRADGVAFNPAWYYRLFPYRTAFERDGVAGHIYITPDVVDPADATEVSWTVSIGGGAGQLPRVTHDQPHPDVIRNVLRINGQTMDASRAQVQGDRPQDSTSQIAGVSTFGWMGLQYSAASTEGNDVEEITSSSLARSARGAPSLPIMYYGWQTLDETTDVVFSRLLPSHTLTAIMPDHKGFGSSGRATFAVWVASEALDGSPCFEFTIGDSEAVRCDAMHVTAPDGRLGLGYVAEGTSQVALLRRRLLTVTPIHEEP